MIQKSIICLGKYYLYRHIRKDKDEPFYIGLGTKVDGDDRRYPYKRAVDYHEGNKIWNDIITKTEYEVEVLIETDDYEFLKQKEREFIKLYGRINRGTGILANMTDGGDGSINRKHTPEAIYRMRKAKAGTGRNPIILKALEKARSVKGPMTPEINAKISKKLLGHPVSEKTRIAVSESNKRRDLSKQVEAMRLKNIGGTCNGKKVINIESGEEYASAQIALKSSGYSFNKFYRRLSGKVIDNNFKYKYI